MRYNNQIYQLDARDKRRRLAGHQAIICDHYEGGLSILVNGEKVGYKVFKKGEQPKPIEDENTLNQRFDKAVRKQRYKPEATHPWKKRPSTTGGYRQIQ